MSMLESTRAMENQDFLSRIGGDNNDSDEAFNESGGDLFERLMKEDSNNSSGNFNLSTLDPSLNDSSVLDLGTDKPGGDMELDLDLEASSSAIDAWGGDNKKSDISSLLQGGLSPAVPKAVNQSLLDAAPLNVSLGGGIGGDAPAFGSIAGTLRRNKGSNAQMNAVKANAVKARNASSKLRSNKSDGLLARALKAKYNSSNSINKYSVNALATAGLSNPAIAHGSNASFASIERQGGIGGQNASWGNFSAQRSNNTALLALLQGGNKATPNLVSSSSASSLLRNPKLSLARGSKSSMQDLLRMSRRHSKDQTTLRQSSAMSLRKQMTAMSIANGNNKVDVSSLLPPSHTAQKGGQNSNNSGSETQSPLDVDTSSDSLGDDMESSSLLHQSCRLYPTTAAVVESALRIDPDAVRRAVPAPSEKGQAKKPEDSYGYPVNVATSHGATPEVLKLLVEAAPEVLLRKDGLEGSGSLGIALKNKCSAEIISVLIQGNGGCVKVADRRANYPLHVAVSYGYPLKIVLPIYRLYPTALTLRNFHSQTPLDIAEHSTRCSEDVMNFLQKAAFSSLESGAHHLDESTGNLDDGFDDIMDTNV